MDATILSFTQAHHAAGRGFIIMRPQYRRHELVRVKATRDVGPVIAYVVEPGPAFGRVKAFIQGAERIFDQDEIEYAVGRPMRQGIA